MEEFLRFTIFGLVTTAIYAVAASGLVVTYTTSGIFNFAHGAFGMMAAFVYWQMRFEWGWSAPIALFVMLGIIAPLFGATIERVIFRGLQDVSEVTKLVVSVSLLFGVYTGAQILFDRPTGPALPGLLRRAPARLRPRCREPAVARRVHDRRRGPRRRLPALPAVPHP